MQNEFLAKIITSLMNYHTVADIRGSAVIVAISGGPDSTALLLALKLLQSKLNFELIAAHVNHKMRAEESEQDEQFCRSLCDRLLVPLFVHSAEASKEKNSEDRMRRFRYEFLCEKAKEVSASAVILAHTSTDQVETILFRIFRGTSPGGLVGISPAHRLKDGTTLLRPLLNCSRDEVVAFLQECAIEPRFDSSNNDVVYTRNYLRNSVIPLVKERFPSLDRQVERLQELARSDENFIDGCVQAALNEIGGVNAHRWQIAKIAHLHEAIKRRIIASALRAREVEVSYERVCLILNMMASAKVRQRVSLNENWDVAVEDDSLVWILRNQDELSVSVSETYPVNCPGTTVLVGLNKTLHVSRWQGEDFDSFNREALDILVDLSRISTSSLAVRARVGSDQIQPLGMTQMVRLKKYLHTNNKRPRALESHALVSADEILWIPGVGYSDKIKIVDKPTHRLLIS